MHYFAEKYCGTVYFFIYQKLYRTVLVIKMFLLLFRITEQKGVFFKSLSKTVSIP